MKDSLKHKGDEVSRDLLEEREKALKAFQEHFMGKTEEADPPVETKKGRKTGRRLSREKPKVAADKGLQIFDRKVVGTTSVFFRGSISPRRKNY